MRILHLLWGFSPWREGGLVKYTDDIMYAQAEEGHDVAAFFPGRRELWGKPKLVRWCRGGVRQYEIRNAPLVHLGTRGTFPAISELGETCSERFFEETLDDFVPHVVHIHELAGSPFTLMDILEERNLPLVITLHDYFPLCPTLNLFDVFNEFCVDDSGVGCVVCCNKGSDWGFGDRIRTQRTAGTSRWLYVLPLLLRYAYDWLLQPSLPPKAELIKIYRQRKDQNRQRLKKADIILSQSERTRVIYSERIGRDDIRVSHSSLRHIERFKQRVMPSVSVPVVFATLNGAAAPYKGANLLAKVVDILDARGYSGRYILEIYGWIDPKVHRCLRSSTSVRLNGRYLSKNLDKVLENVHVGIVPSLCEEVYGYVGIEFLAIGIPVIGNQRGGIPDYVIRGRSGWINESCTPSEMAEIMISIIDDPESIVHLNKWITANLMSIVTRFDVHLQSVMDAYAQAIEKHSK